MSDSIGGVVNIAIIVFFIVFSMGYIAFNINYTKAFRTKDKIVALFEKYDGDCLNPSTACYKEIREYADEIGYRPSSFTNIPSDFENYSPMGDLFLYEMVEYSTTPSGVFNYDPYNNIYYNIVTKVNMEIPIVTNIIPIRSFYVTGSTQIIHR